jgi:hypothetical protein
MVEVPVTGALAEYHGRRFPIVFSGDDWVALRAERGVGIPDGFAFGESSVGLGQNKPWVKVPRSVLDGVVHLRVSGTLAGHTVSLRRQLPDGRIVVEFVGPPAAAREMGLEGDQYMGWTGVVDSEELKDIRVEETRRA